MSDAPRVRVERRDAVAGQHLRQEWVPLGAQRDDADVGGVALVPGAGVSELGEADLHASTSTFVFTTVLSTSAGQ